MSNVRLPDDYEREIAALRERCRRAEDMVDRLLAEPAKAPPHAAPSVAPYILTIGGQYQRRSAAPPPDLGATWITIS